MAKKLDIDLKEIFENLQEQLQDFDINDLSLETVGTWPLVVKVISWVLALIIVIVLGYQFMISELITQNDAASAKEQQLKQTFKQKAFMAANLDAYRSQMDDMEESFGALVSQLPSDTEVPGLLEDITNKGSISGLAIDSIDLKQEVSEEFYVKLPIEVIVRGAYHNLGAFVSGVASLPRIVTLTDFTIVPKSKTNKRQDASNLEMIITANTYRYKIEKQAKSRKRTKR
ncbi:Uncharacterised protein [BD1-7 clade bacterium]|uniref:Pilus assembly protein PilP n=1 Tax=BD1-7 clade bacterium TaxID=2029982 RepID=A0A5S9N5U9_9GAMM|nr:Uncharacterised protein [BD1-7 clade bacterium]CAA0085210.1 Uncharacterised protein [BD1-7 clade bacterium]